MLDLNRTEKGIIIFLVVTLFLGILVSVYIKYVASHEVRTGRFIAENERYEEALRSGKRININEADMDGLMKLSGVGRALAGRIIEYRKANGSFGAIDDVKNVKGIGKGLFEKIKDDISVE